MSDGKRYFQENAFAFVVMILTPFAIIDISLSNSWSNIHSFLFLAFSSLYLVGYAMKI